MGSQTASHLAGQPGRVCVCIEQTCCETRSVRYSVLKRQVSKWVHHTVYCGRLQSFVCQPNKITRTVIIVVIQILNIFIRAQRSNKFIKTLLFHFVLVHHPCKSHTYLLTAHKN